MEDNGKVIDLIQKLLALSGSPNENEAILALKKAQELLEKYNLSMRDIPTGQDSGSVNLANIGVPIDSHRWKKTLVHNIALNNFCSTVDCGKKLHILGRNTNVVATITMASWIMEQLDHLAWTETFIYEGRASKLRFRNSFLWGAVDRVVQRLKEGREERTKADPTLRALIVDLKSELDTFLRSQFPKLVNIHTQTYYDKEAYAKGVQVGSGISLYGSHVQVSNSKLIE